MRWLVAVFAFVATITTFAGPAVSMSVSYADLLFPTYGQARHFDQSNEFLGVAGDIYDGVQFTSFVPSQNFTLTVYPTVGQLFGTGDYEYLSVWIDWDQSHVWEPDEEVLNLQDQWFDYGTNPLAFQLTVPGDAVLGDTWLRARFSFDGTLTPAGDCFTGEVEDYSVPITAVPEPSALFLLGGGLLGLFALRRRGARRS